MATHDSGQSDSMLDQQQQQRLQLSPQQHAGESELDLESMMPSNHLVVMSQDDIQDDHADAAATLQEIIDNHVGTAEGQALLLSMSLAPDDAESPSNLLPHDAALMEPPPLTSHLPRHQLGTDSALSEMTDASGPGNGVHGDTTSALLQTQMIIKEEDDFNGDQLFNQMANQMTVVTTSSVLETVTSSFSTPTVVSPVVSIISTSSTTVLSSTSLTPTRKSSRLSTKTAKSYTFQEDGMENEIESSPLQRAGGNAHPFHDDTEDFDEEMDYDEDDIDDDELNNLDEVDIDLDFDQDFEAEDEYRPLKKRKLNRAPSAPVKKLKKKTTAFSSAATRAKNQVVSQQAELTLLRAQLQIYQRQRRVSDVCIDVLSSMNATLIAKMYHQLQGDQVPEGGLSVASFLDVLPPQDPFMIQLQQFSEQFKQVSAEKGQIDQELDFVESLEEAPKANGVKTEDESGIAKRGRKPKASTSASTSTSATKTKASAKSNSAASSSKRKRRKAAKRSSFSKGANGESLEENDDELGGKSTAYNPCPWPNCTYSSKREWALNEHINLTHTNSHTLGCKVAGCPATFFGSSELDNHMKKAHAEIASKDFMPCTWPGCNALFKSKLGLRAHLQVHKGENLIACDWPGCNYFAKNKRQSENHLRKHTGDRPFDCDYPGCGSKFRTNDSLRHHKKSHSEYRPFRCDWPGCEANFKTNRGLTIHRALHTGEKLFKCDWADCEFASERKYHVDLHIYQEHTHTKPYQCNWAGCDASFLRNDKLQNHLKIHRQEKPFKCIHPACDKHFVEKGNMMKHYNNVHKR